MSGDDAQQHIYKTHGLLLNPIMCGVCGWQFYTLGIYNAHQWMQYGERPHAFRCHAQYL
ncbi:hypothetical protein BD309DRAFT_373969 [Dichomitus squalens]|uniref:C2H2-type domain-containing protein n=1 Tax=Dichomitus squalens TaxID=114155 RepID=A0A4Q9NJV3_9APHY|nr:hypothetical protein BD311DRAFT_661557 [Dichomitus squalens]TBU40042.1 hypothetical protein BD309DRAFT_373969 [Dichomitus squalens]TBU53954.1 hypothetical protein BD310DRAFT_829064 [Dichomitus squalens]